MSMQKAVGYSPYFPMFGRDPTFQQQQHMEDEQLDRVASPTQAQVFLERRGQTFKEVMPLTMRNLAIA